MRGVFFCPSYSPPRPQKAFEKTLRLENAWCFFCPLRFPTTSTRRHLEKSRREKSCAHVRGFADFYQRFFFGETPSQKNPRYWSHINQGSQTRKTPTAGTPPDFPDTPQGAG